MSMFCVCFDSHACVIFGVFQCLAFILPCCAFFLFFFLHVCVSVSFLNVVIALPPWVCIFLVCSGVVHVCLLFIVACVCVLYVFVVVLMFLFCCVDACLFVSCFFCRFAGVCRFLFVCLCMFVLFCECVCVCLYFLVFVLFWSPCCCPCWRVVMSSVVVFNVFLNMRVL